MIYFLFLILGLLNLIELTTPIARLSGIKSGELSSGLQLQSSMSILSRVLNTFFMPILGYLSDIQGFQSINQSSYILCILLLVIVMTSFFLIKNYIFSFYTSICKSIISEGSIFKFYRHYNFNELTLSRHKVLTKFKKIRLLTIFAFIPLYIAWPIIFLLIKEFPENRGFILGISSFINGVNSLSLVLFIDPYLIKISKYKSISGMLFKDQVALRFYSLMIAVLMLATVTFYL